MPPIEVGPLGPRPLHGPAPAGEKTVPTPVASDSARAHASDRSAVVRSTLADPGEAPVDAERVATIRKAIERDAYPVIPTRVADAMIAAGLLLRSGK